METHFPHNGYAKLQPELELDVQTELAFPEQDTVWSQTQDVIIHEDDPLAHLTDKLKKLCKPFRFNSLEDEILEDPTQFS